MLVYKNYRGTLIASERAARFTDCTVPLCLVGVYLLFNVPLSPLISHSIVTMTP